jgi:ATP-dependent exoDNAse (exonuclease V) beta subunit
VEHLEDDAERGGTDEAPIVEEGTEGVRMMTVHKAKGLEFPVVMLAEPAGSAARDYPSRHVDPSRRLWLEPLCGCAPVELDEAADEELRRDAAENVRLTYVAATRARELLVVPVCGDSPIEGWLRELNPVLYPPEEIKRESERVLGCPELGEDSVLERGPEGVAPTGGSVRPGVHQSSTNGPPVTWWDPAVLKLDVEEPAPLRQQHILESDPGGVAAAEGEEHYTQWKTARRDVLAQASRPLIWSERVTTLSRSRPADDRVRVERVERIDATRPGGRRFGALVHAVLAAVDLRAGPDNIRDAVSLNARLMDATPEERDGAFGAVSAALAHPLLRQAAGTVEPSNLRRECPVMIRLADGCFAEGIVDLAFRSVGPDFEGWTVVDFKTDREFEGSRDQYTAQIGLYIDAIASATGLRANGVLLVV